MEQENKEKGYWLHDIESGFPYKVSKEQYESHLRMWEIARPRIDSVKGVPILYGTGGSFDGGDISKFFTQNDKWKIIEDGTRE